MKADAMDYPTGQLLDAVDDQDRVIAPVLRREVFRQHKNFRVAHLFLFNDRSELLLQRLASSRDRHPGRWGSSVAAYVNRGESYLQAIERRAVEEIGVQVGNLEPLGKTSMAEESGCTKFVTLFKGRVRGSLEFDIDSDHVSKVEFRPIDSILQLRLEDRSRFTPTFLHLLDFFQDLQLTA